MTYCVGLKLDRGLVMAADTRTNAGLDNIATFRKLNTWQKPDDRVFIILSAGNLAVTQSVIASLDEAIHDIHADTASLFTVATMYQAARMVGDKLRAVRKEVLGNEGLTSESFSAQFIFGGQIKGEEPRLFHIYSEGNFIEAKSDTPFFQIGEHKYGKPILDRVVKQDMRLGEAAKVVLLSFDSTLRSNLSVGMPIDLVVYNTDTLAIDRVRRIEKDDAYFTSLSNTWSEQLRKAVGTIAEFDI